VAPVELNQLTHGIRDFCSAHMLEEKWLLAPSRRVGQQWLDSVALSGQPVLNVHVESFETLALLRLAAPEVDRQGLTFVSGIRREVLLSRIFSSIRNPSRGYLWPLEPSPGLIGTICATIADLRLAGLTAQHMRSGQFEVGTKGEEIVALVSEYEKQLDSQKLVDYPGGLRLAIEWLHAEPASISEGKFVLLPEDMERELWGLERDLWEAIPDSRRVLLKADRPEETPGEALTDALLLRWVNDPTEAPAPRQDGTAAIFRAVGEVNEVREVLQRCLEQRLPLDAVEIIHTDASTYVPLVYEVACRLAPEGGRSVPVTFAEGIPVRYSRPARALMGWLEWIRQDYPQSTLIRLIQDGLLRAEGLDQEAFSFSRLGALLRSVPIGRGRDRYLRVLERELASLEDKEVIALTGDEYDDPARYQRRRTERAAGLRLLRELIQGLFANLPDGDQSQRSWLESAAHFLESNARGASELDEYSRARLLAQIRELAECLAPGDVAGTNVWDWLGELIQTTNVDAQGPRPGCLFVSPVQSGGHSGRPCTYILGLDDSRFPGSGSQDPLLLDGERSRLSGDLPTAGGRLFRKVQGFAELLSRLRGQVTLGYCCRSLDDERAKFPSAPLWSAYRIISGERQGDQEDLVRWLPDPTVAFAPQSPGRCVDLADWWLWRMCGTEAVADPDAAIAASFPHLGQGMVAARARASDLFTEYDGYVPEAGPDIDPAKPQGPVLSAGRLETLGRCPLGYFLQYVLEIEPPREYRIDPAIWLDPLERGSLLHAVFREFMERLQQAGLMPDARRDADLLREVVDKHIALWREEKPPSNPDVLARECQDLHRAARIFLDEEDRYCRGNRPYCFEASIGLPQDGSPTLLDTPDPVAITLPGGAVIQARGRIDRVDELGHTAGGQFAIWDYKTGSAWAYERRDPFRQGRHIQPALYLDLAEARLRATNPATSVSSCGYFFPGLREHGDRISWDAATLREGKAVIATLCEMIRAGCFPFTDDPKDVTYSDYLAVFGDADLLAQATVRKLANQANDALAPFRRLRGLGGN